MLVLYVSHSQIILLDLILKQPYKIEKLEISKSFKISQEA